MAATLKPQQITEVNEIIEKIEKEVKAKCEIGAQSKTILRSLLAANKVKKKAKFFDVKREYSDTIVNYFVTEKGITKNKFSMNSKETVYLLL
jgi:hypothetical protein